MRKKELQKIICKVGDVKWSEITSATRQKHLFNLRVIYANIRRKEGLTQSEIAKELNHQRATIAYYLDVLEGLCFVDKRLKNLNREITEMYEANGTFN
jgi:predicted transcriptional regulator